LQLNGKGFSIVEVMVSLLLLSGLGLGVMHIGQQQSKWQSGVSRSGDLSRSFELMRNIFADPKACELNFKDKQVGDSLNALYNSDGAVGIQVGSQFSHNAYILTGIKIDQHDPGSSQTKITFSYRKTSASTRSTSLTKSFNIFTRFNSGKIVDCLDPTKLTAESAKLKSCFDLDPLIEGDCEKNFQNNLDEIKKLFCENQGFLEYDASSKTCKPLDSGKLCGSGFYFKGYDANGAIICSDAKGTVIPPQVNGVCGSSNGTSSYSAPTANFCSAGTASPVSGSGPWSWACNGSNGGLNASCYALLAINAVCGSSNGMFLTSAPTTNLCSMGTASGVSGVGPWTWTCYGINGGANTNCSASPNSGYY
jgi:hypothetical protein